MIEIIIIECMNEIYHFGDRMEHEVRIKYGPSHEVTLSDDLW